MNDSHRSPVADERSRPCPLCGGRGDYLITPVGHVLCPNCKGKRSVGRVEKDPT